ncbi:NADH dehydrogenase ubiquinone 1 beta subcomplex subunit 3-B [Hondaea fermentalgiana]|uniref:NADH dehydrogenase ubiquinone 1 beta subcomplex subunit 3-B n=1 Tax=Hondaea fermentalgiana TaxID=2315210 RepID=A0A2R5GKX1_9STRA|nr:NADH dehydrogenase ubiquinone 1 beta subcomplex subunit 3-B [Hondaea fermentalgiana]|eukprot:GBG30959.1 NADH dehydrogenase ubiquinone 1 beta subcomplex subunit 3-B [Hondaea fermentalgiana]
MVLGGNLNKWRKHPILVSSGKDVFPGLRSAVIIFGVYCTGEFIYKKLTHPGLSIDPSSLKWEKEVGEKPTLVE